MQLEAPIYKIALLFEKELPPNEPPLSVELKERLVESRNSAQKTFRTERVKHLTDQSNDYKIVRLFCEAVDSRFFTLDVISTPHRCPRERRLYKALTLLLEKRTGC